MNSKPETEDVLSYFGLEQDPFEASGDSPYRSKAFEKLVGLLNYLVCFGEKNLVLTGPVGVGKSVFLDYFASQLQDHVVCCFFEALDTDTPTQLVDEIVNRLSIPVPVDFAPTAKIRAVHHHLKGLSRNGQLCLVMMDDADQLSSETLLGFLEIIDEIGVDTDLHILLTGSPKLLQAIKPNEQRIERSFSYHELGPLAVGEIKPYIQNCFEVSGHTDNIPLTSDEIQNIIIESAGLPSNINRLTREAMHGHMNQLLSSSGRKRKASAKNAEAPKENNDLAGINAMDTQDQDEALDSSEEAPVTQNDKMENAKIESDKVVEIHNEKSVDSVESLSDKAPQTELKAPSKKKYGLYALGGLAILGSAFLLYQLQLQTAVPQAENVNQDEQKLVFKIERANPAVAQGEETASLTENNGPVLEEAVNQPEAAIEQTENNDLADTPVYEELIAEGSDQPIPEPEPVATETSEPDTLDDHDGLLAVEQTAEAIVAEESLETEMVGDSQYSADEQDVLNRSADEYVLQLVGSSSETKVAAIKDQLETTLAKDPAAQPQQLRIIKTTRDGQPWHTLIWVGFEDKIAASVANNQRPEPLRTFQPWVRNIKAIQQALEAP